MFKKLILLFFIMIACGLILVQSDWFWDTISPVYYKDLVYKYAKKYEIDPFLASAIIKVESSFYSSAQSPKGAIGLMQIMPATGREIAAKLNLRPFCISDLYDPGINIQIGLYYFVMLKKEFNDNLYLTLAAYNGGPRNVKKWLAQNRISSQISKEDLKNIPFKETRLFVQSVIWNYEWFKTINKIRELLQFRG